MSLVDELEGKVPKLNSVDLARFRGWFEQYLEDHLELRDEVKAELDEAWEGIGKGGSRIRQAPSGHE